ncbi:unnamed protein product, partial [Ilex paraguariensis]
PIPTRITQTQSLPNSNSILEFLRSMDKVNLNSNWVRGSCIGRGSFGTVNLAVKNSNGAGEVFAVKSVNQSSCLSSQLEALDNEIRILQSLSSPYVVKYLGDDVTCESPTTSYRNLHIEYLPGGTLADIAKRSGADVDERIAASYTWCIVSALGYVHSKGIVHCDVKGKNVLVGPTHSTAKLADFGSATESTDVISPRGSPLWMAPEVIRREYQGTESDVWSLGCTVIEMITGRPAWEDWGADTLCRIGYSDELPEFPTQLSEQGRDFLEKCLRRDPSERWSCDQLLEHPFISISYPPAMITDSSPRCVLDWFSSELSHEDDEEICYSFDNLDGKARKRIGELASKTGANWESDGWTAVRGLTSATEEVSDACCCEEEGEGTSSTYLDSIRTEEEIFGASLEYLNSTGVVEVNLNGRTNMEHSDSDSSLLMETLEYYYYDVVSKWNGRRFGGVEAGSSCQYGSIDWDWVVESRGVGSYSYSRLLLMHFFLNNYDCTIFLGIDLMLYLLCWTSTCAFDLYLFYYFTIYCLYLKRKDTG